MKKIIILIILFNLIYSNTGSCLSPKTDIPVLQKMKNYFTKKGQKKSNPVKDKKIIDITKFNTSKKDVYGNSSQTSIYYPPSLDEIGIKATLTDDNKTYFIKKRGKRYPASAGQKCSLSEAKMRIISESLAYDIYKSFGAFVPKNYIVTDKNKIIGLASRLEHNDYKSLFDFFKDNNFDINKGLSFDDEGNLNIKNGTVKLKGLVEICTAALFLHDYDFIGGKSLMNNIGVIPVYNKNNEIDYYQAVKIDPGEASLLNLADGKDYKELLTLDTRNDSFTINENYKQEKFEYCFNMRILDKLENKIKIKIIKNILKLTPTKIKKIIFNKEIPKKDFPIILRNIIYISLSERLCFFKKNTTPKLKNNFPNLNKKKLKTMYDKILYLRYFGQISDNQNSISFNFQTNKKKTTCFIGKFKQNFYKVLFNNGTQAGWMFFKNITKKNIKESKMKFYFSLERSHDNLKKAFAVFAKFFTPDSPMYEAKMMTADDLPINKQYNDGKDYNQGKELVLYCEQGRETEMINMLKRFEKALINANVKFSNIPDFSSRTPLILNRSVLENPAISYRITQDKTGVYIKEKTKKINLHENTYIVKNVNTRDKIIKTNWKIIIDSYIEIFNNMKMDDEKSQKEKNEILKNLTMLKTLENILALKKPDSKDKDSKDKDKIYALNSFFGGNTLSVYSLETLMTPLFQNIYFWKKTLEVDVIQNAIAKTETFPVKLTSPTNEKENTNDKSEIKFFGHASDTFKKFIHILKEKGYFKIVDTITRINDLYNPMVLKNIKIQRNNCFTPKQEKKIKLFSFLELIKNCKEWEAIFIRKSFEALCKEFNDSTQKENKTNKEIAVTLKNIFTNAGKINSLIQKEFYEENNYVKKIAESLEELDFILGFA